MAAPSLTSNVPSSGPRNPPNSTPRASEARPVRKLTELLLGTYREINEVYYQKKRERQRQRESAQDTEFDIQEGIILNGRYRVQKALGKGSFGQVVRAEDITSEGSVAVKIIRARPAFRVQALTEIKLLELLAHMDPDDKWCIVRLREKFEHEGHTCLVFEHLSFNLYELLHRTRFNGVSLNLVRKFARQMLKTLAFLSLPDIDIIHCDLKPENILLRVSNRSAIKVIDFGSSCKRTEQMYVYIQSRFYRSPEVILGLPYSQAIDMWSLGTILVELHVGTPLFAGEDEHDQILRFASLKGLPPQWMLEKGKKTAKFFDVYSPRVSPPQGPGVGAADAAVAAAKLASRRAHLAARAKRRARAEGAGWGGYSRKMAPVPEKPAADAPGAAGKEEEEEPHGRKVPGVSKVPLTREHDWPAREVPLEHDSDEDEVGDADAGDWLPVGPDGAELAPDAPPALGGAEGADTAVRPVALPVLGATASGDQNGGSGGSSGQPVAHTAAGTGGGEAGGAFTATAGGGTAKLRRLAAHARRMARLRRPAKDAHQDVVKFRLKARTKAPKKPNKVAKVHTDLAELLGVHSGGPGGRRAGEKEGHSEWHYRQFMDMVLRMLEYDPHVRITPMQALNHPFLREDNPPGWDPTAPGNSTADSASAAMPFGLDPPAGGHGAPGAPGDRPSLSALPLPTLGAVVAPGAALPSAAPQAPVPAVPGGAWGAVQPPGVAPVVHYPVTAGPHSVPQLPSTAGELLDPVSRPGPGGEGASVPDTEE